MIIKQHKNEIESFNVGRKAQFKILADAMAFKSLSEGLYSNKVRAVVREYTSNAVDAHIAAGKREQPVFVHLPNRFEPWFSVRDEGTGLSEDQVMELYVTYFDSSKRECELSNGGFGLGSKSAFAYGQSFTIVSVFDGYRKTYSAYIDESGLPSMVKLAEEATTDVNGVEVKVPVEMSDIARFTNEASFVYEFYPVRPEIVGAEVAFGTHDFNLSGTDWKMEKVHGFEVYAIVGSIAYPVANEEVRFKAPIHGRYYINFTVNEVELTRSRESISFTEDTVKTITAKFEKVIAEVVEIFQKDIDAQPDIMSAAKFIFSVKGLNRSDEFVYNGAKHTLDALTTDRQNLVNKIFGIDPKAGTLNPEYPVVAFYYDQYYKRGYNHVLRQMGYFSVAHFIDNAVLNPKTTFMFLNGGSGKALKNRIRAYAEANALVKVNHYFVVFMGSAEANLKKVCEHYMIDDKSVVNADTTMPSAPRSKRAPGTANAYLFDSGSYRATKVADIQDEEIFYAIDTDENRNNSFEASYIGDVAHALKQVGVDLKAKPYYVIPKRNLAFFEDVNVTELKPYITKLVQDNEAKLRIEMTNAGVRAAASRYAEKRGATNIFKQLGFNLNGSDFGVTIIDRIGAFKNTIAADIEALSKLELDKMKNAIAEYPMFDKECKEAQWGHKEYEDKEVKHYIKLVDAAKAAGITVTY